jgi:hypothetical protein
MPGELCQQLIEIKLECWHAIRTIYTECSMQKRAEPYKRMYPLDNRREGADLVDADVATITKNHLVSAFSQLAAAQCGKAKQMGDVLCQQVSRTSHWYLKHTLHGRSSSSASSLSLSSSSDELMSELPNDASQSAVPGAGFCNRVMDAFCALSLEVGAQRS